MKPITDTDVHQAAAALHHAMTADPYPEQADEFLARSSVWHEASQDKQRRGELRARVRDLVVDAADVSEWAIELGATGLQPYHSHAWRSEGGFDVAVQVAASPRMLPGIRREFVRAVHTAVENTYASFMARIPARSQEPTR